MWRKNVSLSDTSAGESRAIKWSESWSWKEPLGTRIQLCLKVFSYWDDKSPFVSLTRASDNEFWNIHFFSWPPNPHLLLRHSLHLTPSLVILVFSLFEWKFPFKVAYFYFFGLQKQNKESFFPLKLKQTKIQRQLIIYFYHRALWRGLDLPPWQKFEEERGHLERMLKGEWTPQGIVH